MVKTTIEYKSLHLIFVIHQQSYSLHTANKHFEVATWQPQNTLLIIILLQILQSLSVAFESQPADCTLSVKRDVRELPECLAGGNIGKMHLHSGQRHSLESVENSHTRVGVGRRIDENCIHAIVSPLNGIDNGTLVVGLEKLDLDAQFTGTLADELLQCRKVLRAIEGGLAKAQQIEVGAVDY